MRCSDGIYQCVAASLLVTLCATPVSGQPSTDGVVEGVVRDAQGAVIPGAMVDIRCRTVWKTASTQADGAFRASSLPRERCTATVTSPMFETAILEVDLANGAANPDVRLKVRSFATEIVVTPTPGVKETSFNVPESTSVTTRGQIDARPYALVPQVLREEPGILLQQTTTSQTSPIIRGFTGQSNVYLLDGVRFNTASWRSGPSQYFAWIDEGAVDRYEVVRGPGSVQYGSDALGGTINVLAAPAILPGGWMRISGMFDGALGSAERAASGRAELQLQKGRSGLRGGLTVRDVDDLRTGDRLDSHSALTRFLGLSSTTEYTRLPATGYQQQGGFLTGSTPLGGATLRGLYVRGDLDGTSRYDRLLGGDGLYRSGFDPQTLDFGHLRYERTGLLGLDGVSGTFSVNRQADGRYEQTRPSARLDSQHGTTTALGYQVHGHRAFGSRYRVSLGAEYYDESTSAERLLFEPNGVITPSRPDIPDGTEYSTLGVFTQAGADLASGRVNVRGGLRYGRFAFSTAADPQLGVIDEHVVSDAVTFQAATVIAVTDNINAMFTMSRGFRAANAADLGSIGLSGGGGFEVAPSVAAELGGIVGSTGATGAVSTGEAIPALSPEILYSYEGGLKFSSSRFDAAFTAFDLEFHDAIQRRAIVFPEGIVGTVISGRTIVRQDATGLGYIAEDVRPVGTRVNVDHSRIRGFDVQGQMRLRPGLSAGAFFSMSNGTILTTNEYMRRMPPPLGGANVRWSSGTVWVEGFVGFAREQARLNSGDLSDARIGGLRTRASIATFFNGTAVDMGLVSNGVLLSTGETLTQVQNRVLGTANSAPLFTSGEGWITFGARAGWQITPHVGVSVIGENLTDANYRLYGSGVDGPGANGIVRLRYRF